MIKTTKFDLGFLRCLQWPVCILWPPAQMNGSCYCWLLCVSIGSISWKRGGRGGGVGRGSPASMSPLMRKVHRLTGNEPLGPAEIPNFSCVLLKRDDGAARSSVHLRCPHLPPLWSGPPLSWPSCCCCCCCPFIQVRARQKPYLADSLLHGKRLDLANCEMENVSLFINFYFIFFLEDYCYDEPQCGK